MTTSPQTGSRLLYLNDRALRDLDLTPASVREAVRAGFQQHAQGKVITLPKQTFLLGPGHFFQSLSATTRDPAHAAVKWVGIAKANTALGLPNVNGLIVLSDAETGLPLAIMDANRLTVARTAGMSALAAQYLARPGSRSIGFVGCGQQALGHLHALLDVLPELDTVLALASRLETASSFAQAARKLGLTADATDRADAILECDVVVSSVSSGPDLVPFLDANRLHEGCFVCAADLGRPWLAHSLDIFDLKATDDKGQSSDPANRRKLSYQGDFDFDLAGMVTSTSPLRTTDRQRALFLFPGFAVGDLAVAGLAYAAALSVGAGVWLDR